MCNSTDSNRARHGGHSHARRRGEAAASSAGMPGWLTRALLVVTMIAVVPSWGCGGDPSDSTDAPAIEQAPAPAQESREPAMEPGSTPLKRTAPPAGPKPKVTEAVPTEDYERSRASAGMDRDRPQDADPEEIAAFESSLAASIAEQREHAERGDLLDPELVAYLSRATAALVETEKGHRVLDAIKEGNPAFDEDPSTVMPDLQVNGPYPEDAPLSSVPPVLLQLYPKLPEGIEYRFVGCRLILFERDARLILDYTDSCLI